MKKLTLWGAAFLGVFIFSMTMLSQAMSNTSESAMARDPTAGNFSQAVGSNDNLTMNRPSSTTETSAPPKNNMLSDLLRVDERHYDVTIAPWVSRKVLTRYRVRKFGFGRLENVSIISTASGTYSSDALKSANIIYPGIIVNKVRPFQVAKAFTLLVWQSRDGWKALESSGAPSFLNID